MRHGVRCEQDGRTALMYASINDNTEVVVQLLDKGADVNAQDKVRGGAYGICTGTREGALRECVCDGACVRERAFCMCQ